MSRKTQSLIVSIICLIISIAISVVDKKISPMTVVLFILFVISLIDALRSR